MNTSHKEFFSITLTISIILLTVFIVHRFIPSMVWAAIIASATYPLYRRWRVLFRHHDNFSALSFSALLGLLFLLPLSGLIGVLVSELQIFINYIQLLNREGGASPIFLKTVPFIGQELIRLWDENLGKPGNVMHLLSHMNLSLAPLSYYIKQVGFNLAHRGVQIGFTLLTLFFFYRDGEKIYAQVNRIGTYCLDKRWFRYAEQLPSALRGTVNGTILVGLGVGLCMGICYAALGFPTPTLTGFITAFAAMIPFVVPLVFLVVALIFFVSSKFIAAIIVLGWGTLVMFVADHFIKPSLIGGAIRLPFLAVLFGILGGLETLGFLGLFVGPIIMVMFVTLCQEFQTHPAVVNSQ